MSAISIEKLNAYVASKTKLDKGTKHNPAEIVRGTVFLTAKESISPYLAMQSRVILFKKLDLWQAQYHTMDLVRVSGFREYDVLVPVDVAAELYGLMDSKRDEHHAAALKKAKMTEEEFGKAQKDILRQLSMGKKNKEELSGMVSCKDLDTVLDLMVRERELSLMEPLGWHGDNFKYDIFGNDFKITALDPAKAKTALIKRTFEQFSPMTFADVAQFLSVDEADVAETLKNEDLIEVEVEDFKGLMIAKKEMNNLKQFSFADSRIVVNLLPALDSYLTAYADKKRYVGTVSEKDNVILVNGKAMGTWSMKDTTVKLKVDSDDEHIREHVLHEARFLVNLFGAEVSDWTFKM